MVEYNKEKLTNTSYMSDKRVLILGVGAVGSMLAEALVRNQTGLIAVIDKDYYESDNLPKSSSLIRLEDVGKSKALALASRMQAVAAPGCKVIGHHMDVKRIGPMVFNNTNWDYVVLALDNMAVKVYLANVIGKIPKDKRPIVISGGTNKEFSECMIFVKDGACLRCTISDEMLSSEDPAQVFSCAAKVNLALPEKVRAITSTSGIASMKCALDADDMILSHAQGHYFESSERYVQYPYSQNSQKEGHRMKIRKHRSCPVCTSKPPEEDISVLFGAATARTTLRELLDLASPYFNEGSFHLRVNCLNIPGVHIRQAYQHFIETAECNNCRKKFKVMSHNGLLHEIVCPVCQSYDTTANNILSSFDYSCSDDVLNSTLYDLGFPIGGYYEFEEKKERSVENKEEEALPLADVLNDFLDVPKSKLFYLKEDETYLHESHCQLQGNLEEDGFCIEVVNTSNNKNCGVVVFPENTLFDIIDVCSDIGLSRNNTKYCMFEYNGLCTMTFDITMAEFNIVGGAKLLFYRPRF